MTNAQSTIDLHQYWDVFRSRKWAVIIPTLLALLLAAAYVFALHKPQYTATAKVLVTPIITPSTNTATGKGNTPDMNTEQAVASSTPVGLLVRKSLKIPSSNGDRLLSHLTVSATSTGNILQFQYTSTDAQQAAQYANAFAQAYITYRNSTAVAPLARAITERQHTISTIEAQLPHAGKIQRGVLVFALHADVTQLAQFQADQQLVSAGRVITTAVASSPSSSSKVAKTLLIAGVIGLVIGLCIALIREAMDGRIKNPDALESRLRAPVLGVIPKFDARSPERSLATIADPRGAASEAYRMAAITLEYTAARESLRMIMVVSPQDGGGASTTVANLGVVLAQAGHRVILVSADLRVPLAAPHLRPFQRARVLQCPARGNGPGAAAERSPRPQPVRHDIRPGAQGPGGAAGQSRHRRGPQHAEEPGPGLHPVGGAAVLSASDAVILSRQVEGTVITWNGEEFEAPALRKAQERLEVAGANILGGIYTYDRSKDGKSRKRRPKGARPEAPFVPRETRKATAPVSRADGPLSRRLRRGREDGGGILPLVPGQGARKVTVIGGASSTPVPDEARRVGPRVEA